MSTKNLVILLILLSLVAVGLSKLGLVGTLPAQSSSSTSVSSTLNPEDAASVSEAIRGFGRQLRMVSLLSATDTLSADMHTYYAPYVAPELIASWETDPSIALGRRVSSPWPDRIVVDSVNISGASADVQGRVVESTSAGVAALYPIEFSLQKRGETWLITSATSSPYADFSSARTILGTYECLPHANQSAPQTLECALGIKEDATGDQYALDTSLLEMPPSSPTGAHLSVKGLIVPIESLNSDHWRMYDIKGIIQVLSIQS